MPSAEPRTPIFTAAFVALAIALVLDSAGADDSGEPKPAPDPLPCAIGASGGSKPASAATQRHNAGVGAELGFADRQDFEDAKRGLIARPDRLTIKDAAGHVVWDLEAYQAFIAEDQPAPDSVNPSLWRNAQLELQHGLFEVVDGVYQVRGYDLSNITFVRGKTGWIVGDPPSAPEVAQAAYELVSAHLGQKPVVAVIYTHTHLDHYAGVRALVSPADVQSGKVTVVAPDAFSEHAAVESALGRDALRRRAAFQLGSLLAKSARGSLNGGLARAAAPATSSRVVPNDRIEQSGERRSIDGVELLFQLPAGDAPVEMSVFFPGLRALWLAEDISHAQHDRLTPRGPEPRDPLGWARFLDDTIAAHGAQIDTELSSHHWPVWGNARVVERLEKQRDRYQFIHDQSVRLINQGYDGAEVAERIQLPPELALPWYNRDYYGSLKQSARAVYQRSIGNDEPNPAALDPLPPAAAAQNYVAYMGGAGAVLEKARADFERGEYRWVAEALRHVVLADPNAEAAKNLLADTYEQLGYQSESIAWRTQYLEGARELRQGPTPEPSAPRAPDAVRALPLEQLFARWGVRLDAQKAAGKRLALVFSFSDLQQQWALSLRNSVLSASRQIPAYPDASVTLTRAALDTWLLGESSPEQSIASGQWTVTGRAEALSELLALLDPIPPAPGSVASTVVINAVIDTASNLPANAAPKAAAP